MAVLSVPQIPADELRDISQLSDDKAWELDDKVICDAAQKSWTLRAYKHFDVSLERRYTEHGERSLWFKFICKTDPANHSPQFRARKNTSSGTNNLLRRALACDARVGTNNQTSLASLPTKFSLARFRAYLALWSARNHRPFELVEDELFEAMVNELRPGTVVPDRTTISRDLQSIYQDNTKLITQYFKNVDVIHLAMDGWTAPTSQSFLGIVVIWQEAGTLRRTVLEFVGLSHRHTGEYLAQKTAKCLNKYQLGKKLLTVCMDNAGNNDTFTVELQKHFPTFGGRSSRVRCIAHILNLMAKAYLNVFSQPVVPKRAQKRKSNSKSNPQPKRRQLEQAAVALPTQSRVSSNSTRKSSRSSNDINPNPPTNASTPFEPSPNDPGSYDDADAASESDGGGDSDVEETVKAFADDNIDEDKHDFDESTVKSSVQNAFADIQERFGVVVLPEDRQKGREVLTKAARLAKRVRNSPYFQSQFEEYLSKTPLSNSRHCKLLSDFQWDLAEQLISELKIFERLTKIFSETEIPLIHQVVPALWKLQDRLSATVNSPAPHLHPLLRVAAHASLDVFNKYMLLFEDSSIYWIALVMCPHYKLEWFRNRAYSESNIQRMTGLVHSKFDQMLADTEEASVSQTNESQATQWHESLEDDLLSDDELGDDLAPRCQDTIQGYLDAPLVPVDILRREGLLGHWARQQSVMPRVAKFALGILSAPASSVDAERAFSGGRLNINHLQHSMSELTFEAKMAVGLWFDTPLLPSVETAAAIIKSKMRD